MNRTKLLLFRILVPLVILGSAEMTARAVDLRTHLVLRERRGFAAYRGQPWADQYFHDLVTCARQTTAKHQARYARYVLETLNEDCATPTVNYANRLRHTWNVPAIPAGTAVREIGMFGGSTMEGLGAIDDQTIPSYLSHILNETPDGVVFHTTNYGVSGYTYTQSVFRLLTLLREGHHFDVVVFYDGANDTDYAYELGEAGALDGEDVAEIRIEGSAIRKFGLFVKEEMNDCVLCLAGAIVARHTPVVRSYVTPYIVKLRDAIHFKRSQDEGRDMEQMAQSIATYYAESHDLLDHIAAVYHIERLEFWQPTLMYDTAYGPGEAPLAGMDPRLTDDRLRELYRRVRELVRAKRLDQFEDISDVLDGRKEQYYLDAVHLSGNANKQVAARIIESWHALHWPVAMTQFPSGAK